MSFDNSDPIVVGGLGGSGTRVVAAVLRQAGVFIGGCLNESLDNLWFTLLFRRPKSIRGFDHTPLLPHLEMLVKRMHGRTKWTQTEKAMLRRCAVEFVLNNYVRSSRIGFPYRVYNSFFNDHPTARKTWGWKEPNAHIFLPLLAERFPNLRYVHVLRHPLDIAFGKNHLQLHNWKHLFRITETNEHRAAIMYYDAANQRAMEIGKRLGGERFLLLKHETICGDSKVAIDSLLSFCGLNANAALRETLYAIPKQDNILTRYAEHDFSAMLPLAADVASRFGYTV